MRAEPDRGFVCRSPRNLGRRLGEELAAAWQQVFAAAVGQPTEVANAWEALGQDVLDEAAQELLAGKSHRPLAAVMCVVLPSKGHVRVGDDEEAVVGDGDAVSIARQILQNVFGSAEWRLG